MELQGQILRDYTYRRNAVVVAQDDWLGRIWAEQHKL